MTESDIVGRITTCFLRGGTLYVMGNGGSAAEAQHFAAEFIHDSLPAISLTADTAVLTSTSNDFSYKEVFAKQIAALCKPNDLVIGLSTSGKSENILYAYEWCNKLNVEYIDFPREGDNTQNIQEKQLAMIHRVWKSVVDQIAQNKHL